MCIDVSGRRVPFSPRPFGADIHAANVLLWVTHLRIINDTHPKCGFLFGSRQALGKFSASVLQAVGKFLDSSWVVFDKLSAGNSESLVEVYTISLHILCMRLAISRHVSRNFLALLCKFSGHSLRVMIVLGTFSIGSRHVICRCFGKFPTSSPQVLCTLPSYTVNTPHMHGPFLHSCA